MDRCFPVKLGLDGQAIKDWNYSPYVSFDYGEYFKQVNVPKLAFTSGLFGAPSGLAALANITSADSTQIMLPNYGYIDVYIGTYSTRDVSEPSYQWLLNHLSRPK